VLDCVGFVHHTRGLKLYSSPSITPAESPAAHPTKRAAPNHRETTPAARSPFSAQHVRRSRQQTDGIVDDPPIEGFYAEKDDLEEGNRVSLST
jgi:hypothetical protein